MYLPNPIVNVPRYIKPNSINLRAELGGLWKEENES